MKTALITGGSSGIGYTFAVKLLSEVYRVVLLSRDEQKLRKAVADLKRKGFVNVSYVTADVSDMDSLQAALKRASLGSLDLVIHSAGILRVGAPSAEKLEACRKTNVRGTINVLRATEPLLQKAGGRIAVLCSVAGFINFPGYADYGVSKATQREFCENKRKELMKKGIGLTMIYPSTIRTPMVTDIRDQLPPIAYLAPWHDATKVVETFYRDIEAGRDESYVSFGERLTAKLAPLAPWAFLALLKVGMKIKGLK